MQNRRRHDLPDTFIEQRHCLYSVALQIVRRRELAEDVLQSAYERIVAASARLVPERANGYCYQVVRHLAVDYSRRKRFESRFFSAKSNRCMALSSHLSPEQATIALQSLILVQQSLALLPARTLKAFMLYRLEGLTQRRIAMRLHVSLTLVNFMIRDAVEMLETCRQKIDGAD